MHAERYGRNVLPFIKACCLRQHGIWVTSRRHMPEESDCHNHFHHNLPSHSFIHFLLPLPIHANHNYLFTFYYLFRNTFQVSRNPADITTSIIPCRIQIQILRYSNMIRLYGDIWHKIIKLHILAHEDFTHLQSATY